MNGMIYKSINKLTTPTVSMITDDLTTTSKEKQKQSVVNKISKGEASSSSTHRYISSSTDSIH
eukprot:6128897-Ditylum_brightwellii.AAC.1